MNPDDQSNKDKFHRDISPISHPIKLTPAEKDMLLYDAYNESSLVRLRKNIGNETLDRIPLFRILEAYLEIVQRSTQVELTAVGTLPQTLLVEIYEKRFITDPLIDEGVINLVTEDNCISILSACMTAEVAGFVDTVDNKHILTAKGAELMQSEKRAELFITFFKTFTDEFPWTILDAHTEEPVAQIGWGFSVLMLHKMGTRFLPVSFYAASFIAAFLNVVEYFETRPNPFSYAAACYKTRTFDRFLPWFGLINLEEEASGDDPKRDKVKASPILREVFQFEEELG